MATYEITTEDGAVYEIDTADPSPQPSRMGQAVELGSSVLGSLGSAINPMAQLAMKVGKAVAKNPRQAVLQGADYIPAAGGIALPVVAGLASGGTSIPASAALSGLGMAGGEGYKQLIRRGMGENPAPSLPNPVPFTKGNLDQTKILGLPAPRMSPEVSNLVNQGAIGVVGDLAGAGLGTVAGKISNVMKGTSVGSARRALGNTKANLTSTKSWKDALRKQVTANKTAEELLDVGAISKTGNTNTTFKNVLKVRDKSVKGLNSVLNKADEAGGLIDTNQFVVEMQQALKPKYPDEIKAFDKIIEDIGAGEVSPGKLSLVEAKTRIKSNLGKSWESPPSGRAIALTRKASQFLENKISSNVKQSLGEYASKLYKLSNSTFGKSENALRTLAPQQALEMGNQFPSLTATAVGAGRLAAGDVPGALMSSGGMELLKRRGAGITANTLNAGSKLLKQISPQTAPALLKAMSRKRGEAK